MPRAGCRGRDAGRDPKEARGSSQDSSPKGHDAKNTNVPFDGPDANEDFGLEQIKGNPADRYAFRTSPLRNVVLQPTFFHNGTYTRLEDALRFHLDAISSARKYNRAQAGVDNDLRVGPIEPVLKRIDPLLATPIRLNDDEC